MISVLVKVTLQEKQWYVAPFYSNPENQLRGDRPASTHMELGTIIAHVYFKVLQGIRIFRTLPLIGKQGMEYEDLLPTIP